jgi:hypothetical protein
VITKIAAVSTFLTLLVACSSGSGGNLAVGRDECFANLTFEIVVTDEAALGSVLESAEARLGKPLPIPPVPPDAYSVATGHIPSSNDNGWGFAIQYNYEDREQPVVSIFYALLPRCWYDRGNLTRSIRVLESEVDVFDFQLDATGSRGRMAQTVVDKIHIEMMTLWRPEDEPAQSVQDAAIDHWIERLFTAVERLDSAPR